METPPRVEQRESPSEKFFRAVVRGNGEYPQMTTGVNIYGGKAIMPFLVSGQMSWEDFTDMSISPSDLEEYRERMIDLHTAFSVPSRPPMYRVANVYNTAKRNIAYACLRFEHPDFSFVRNTELNEYQKYALENFFNDPEKDKERQAFLSLWRSGAEVLHEEKKLAEQHREEWRGGNKRRTVQDRQRLQRPYLTRLREHVQERAAQQYPFPEDAFKKERIHNFVVDTVRI